MKHPRRWAALLAAFLIAASLTLVPREGAAWPPYIDGDPSPPNEGEPDGPPNSPVYVTRESRPWSLSLTFMQGRWFLLVGPARPPRIANQRPSKPLVLRPR